MSSSMDRVRLQFALFLATITVVDGQVSSAPVLDDTTALIILSVLLGLSVFICLSLTGCIVCVCYYKYRLGRGTGDRSRSKEGRWFPFRLRRNRTHCVGSSRNRDENMFLKHLTSVDSSNSEGLSTPVANYPENEDMYTGSENRKDRQPSAVTASKVEVTLSVTEEKIEKLEEVEQSGHQYSATPDPTHKFVKNDNFNLRTRKDSMSYHDIPGSCLEGDPQISASKSEGCLATNPPENKPVKKPSLMDRREIAKRWQRQRTDSTRGLLRSESSDTHDPEGTDSDPDAFQGIGHYNELMRTVPEDKHVTMVKSPAYDGTNTTQDSSHEDLVITPL